MRQTKGQIIKVPVFPIRTRMICRRRRGQVEENRTRGKEKQKKNERSTYLDESLSTDSGELADIGRAENKNNLNKEKKEASVHRSEGSGKTRVASFRSTRLWASIERSLASKRSGS